MTDVYTDMIAEHKRHQRNIGGNCLDNPNLLGINSAVCPNVDADQAKVNKVSLFNNEKTKVDDDEIEMRHWVELIIKQDQDAFNRLFKIMATRVYSIALRITGTAQLAEEVSEDTFYQIWRQAPRFDPGRGTVSAWVMTIARSRALDAWRAQPPFESIEDSEIERQHCDKKTQDLQDLLSASEQNRLLHDALSTLDPVPRQLVALAFFRGLSHEEIAQHAGLPLGTVKSHLRRTLLHLRELLTPTINLANS